MENRVSKYAEKLERMTNTTQSSALIEIRERMDALLNRTTKLTLELTAHNDRFWYFAPKAVQETANEEPMGVVSEISFYITRMSEQLDHLEAEVARTGRL